MQLILTIPDEYITRLNNAIKGVYPIPKIINPEYEENPENPTAYDPETPQYINQYPDIQWAKIKIKDFLVNTLNRYEQKEAARIAKDGINIPSDLVS